MAGALSAHVMVRETVQFLVNQRGYPLRGAAWSPSLQATSRVISFGEFVCIQTAVGYVCENYHNYPAPSRRFVSEQKKSPSWLALWCAVPALTGKTREARNDTNSVLCWFLWFGGSLWSANHYSIWGLAPCESAFPFRAHTSLYVWRGLSLASAGETPAIPAKTLTRLANRITIRTH